MSTPMKTPEISDVAMPSLDDSVACESQMIGSGENCGEHAVWRVRVQHMADGADLAAGCGAITLLLCPTHLDAFRAGVECAISHPCPCGEDHAITCGLCQTPLRQVSDVIKSVDAL